MASTTTAPPKEKPESELRATREPFWSLSPFGLTFGRLFDDFWTHLPLGEPGLLSPALDVNETDTEVVVTMEVPGIKKADLKIDFENGVLRVSGEKKSTFEETKADWHRMERRYGSFCRTLSLPPGVKTEDAKAELQDGVLVLRLAKSEQTRPKSIPIQ